MIEITKPIYKHIAKRLKEAIGENNFYNGAVILFPDKVGYEFRATLLIDRNDDDSIRNITAVWWTFSVETSGGRQPSDFSWGKLKEYIIRAND